MRKFATTGICTGTLFERSKVVDKNNVKKATQLISILVMSKK